MGRDRAATSISRSWLAVCAAKAMAGRSAGSSPKTGRLCPSAEELEDVIRSRAGHPLTPARADALQAIRSFGLPTGRISVTHRLKEASILAQACRLGVPMTVHPGIGYDIIANHPIYNGAVIGRAAALDFRLIGGSVETLDGGVVLSVGSAIMGPQVFEKILSCVNNLRLQDGRPIVAGHAIYVVRPPGRRRLGLVPRRTSQDQSGLLSAFLQELCSDGRRDALPPVRQRCISA